MKQQIQNFLSSTIKIQDTKVSEAVKSVGEILVNCAHKGGGEDYLLAAVRRFREEIDTLQALEAILVMECEDLENHKDEVLRAALSGAVKN